MSYRHIALAALLLLLPVAAQAGVRPGEVLLETEEMSSIWPFPRVHSWWVWMPGDPYAGGVAFPLIWDIPRLEGRAPMLAFGSQGDVLVGGSNTIYHWRGTHTFDPVLTYEHELSEIAPRGNHFLAAERFGGKLIEFNLKGRVAEYPFPGGEHIELLSDQCTLLFTAGANDNRVRRMNICTGRTLSDFALLPHATYAGAIRQLPNGEVLVADGNAVRRFTRGGSLAGSYDFPGVTHIALFDGGTKFYAAGVVDGVAQLREFAVARPEAVRAVPLGNPEMVTILVTERISDLTVGGEWRASAAMVRRRAVR